jgi:hypothetical protein
LNRKQNDMYDFSDFRKNQWPPIFDTISILQSLVIAGHGVQTIQVDNFTSNCCGLN